MKRRWAQLVAMAAVAILFGSALAFALRSAPDIAAGGAAPTAENAVPAAESTAWPSAAPPRASAFDSSPLSEPSAPPTTRGAERPAGPAAPVATQGTAPTARPPHRAPGAAAVDADSSGPYASPPEPDDPGAVEEPGAQGTAAPTGSLAPFDPAEARVALQQQANVARHHCSHLPGPRLIEAEVVFSSAGDVARVALAHREQSLGATTGCVKNVLRYARVRPYVGGSERVSVLVPLR